jgi:hypothetical protein
MLSAPSSKNFGNIKDLLEITLTIDGKQVSFEKETMPNVLLLTVDSLSNSKFQLCIAL